MNNGKELEGAATATPTQLAASVPQADIAGSVVVHALALSAQEHAARTIDQRQGVLVSGGTIYGPVVQHNDGTVNTEYTFNTELSVHATFGSLLNIARPVSITRLPSRPGPPAPLDLFHDREQEQARVRALLLPRRGIWLHGSFGCGLSAFLRQILNSPEARALPDGIVYVDGRSAPAALEDVVQQIFNRFYAGNMIFELQQSGTQSTRVAVQVPIEHAQTSLAEIQACFAFDYMPLGRSDLDRLRDLMPRGVVMATSATSLSRTFADVSLGGLPQRDACTLFTTTAAIDASDPRVPLLIEELCPALDCLPLPLLLAATLVKHGTITLDDLVARLNELRQPQTYAVEQAVGQAGSSPRVASRAARPRLDSSLTAITQILIETLTDFEQAVLAALARTDGPDASLPMLVSMSAVPEQDAVEAIEWFNTLEIIEHNDTRYRIASHSLRRVLDRLLRSGAERSRAAAFLAAAAPQHIGDLRWLQSERGNILAAIPTLLAEHQAAQAGVLVKAIQPLVVLRGLWQCWRQVMDWGAQAAQESGD
ncbi:MAG: hypothetical protein JOZ51_03475, partial [Chloroflexi bacterium]|nr:hypothetical protein [Chloroflexota bacterium]